MNHTESSKEFASTETNGTALVSLGELVAKVASREADFPDLILALSPLIAVGERLPTDAALQLSLALHDIESQASLEDQLFQLVERNGAPAMAVNHSGQLLAVNPAASSLMSVQLGDNLSQLGVSATDFAACQQRLHQQQAPTLIKLMLPESTANPQPLIGIVHYHQAFRAFVITALQQHWPQAMDRALAEVFALTESERWVLAELARGQSSEQIAATRQRSLGTIRQQIKAILTKLGAQSQVQAASLASAAANAMSQTLVSSDPIPLLPTPSPLHADRFRRQQRVVGWRRFGDPKGSKVLLLHGPFFGAGDYPLERQWAQRFGFDVYALERPGYGRTEPALRHQSVLDTTVDDIRQLLAQQQIERVQCVTHELGLLPALAFARAMPQACASILAVSPAPPFQELQQLQAMPTQQRIFIWAAQHNPWLVRLLIRLGMVRLRKLGPNHWYQAVFGEIAADMQVLTASEHQEGVVGSYSLNIQQVGAGFMADLQLILSQWSDLVRQADVPVRLLHGATNQTTQAQFLPIFTRLNPQWQIRIRANQGQTLAVADPKWVYQQLSQQRLAAHEH